jgi:ribonuclease P/MRP protein subunit RPP1
MEIEIDFRNLKPDLVRFRPRLEDLKSLGFNSCLYFTTDPENLETVEGTIFPAYLIVCDDVWSLKRELRNAKNSWIVGVLSSETSVIREAISRKKVDILLDSPENKIDYIALKMAGEKDVAVELSLSKFLGSRGAKRMRIFEHVRDVVEMAGKLSTPLLLSSGASNFFEMRSSRQIRDFFSFFGADVDEGFSNARRIIRRYFDEDYLLDGLERLD